MACVISQRKHADRPCADTVAAIVALWLVRDAVLSSPLFPLCSGAWPSCYLPPCNMHLLTATTMASCSLTRPPGQEAECSETSPADQESQWLGEGKWAVVELATAQPRFVVVEWPFFPPMLLHLLGASGVSSWPAGPQCAHARPPYDFTTLLDYSRLHVSLPLPLPLCAEESGGRALT